MDGFHGSYGRAKKKVRDTERPFTTALFLLRCKEIGLTMADLDELTVGMIFDIFAEKSNDSWEWDEIATQEDIDAF